jgi:Crinkler effector protein N-terminal domain
MVTLVCAFAGEKGRAFSVNIDASESVHDLKDAIKQKQMHEFASSKLQLYLGKKSDGMWLDSNIDDVKKLRNGEMNALIKELTHKAKELQGECGLQKVLKGMLEPKTKEIHILVVVPKNTVLDSTLATTVPYRVVDEALHAQQQRSEYSISNCPQSKELLFMQHLGLEYSTITAKEVSDRTIPGYKWLELAENHPDQRQLYAEYPQEHLRDALV